jgi:hypothetical protein
MAEQVVGSWKRLHNEELRNLYPSPYIIRVNKSREFRWTGHVARMGEMRNSYKIFVGKPEGRPRRRWEDNTRMDRRQIE